MGGSSMASSNGEMKLCSIWYQIIKETERQRSKTSIGDDEEINSPSTNNQP